MMPDYQVVLSTMSKNLKYTVQLLFLPKNELFSLQRQKKKKFIQKLQNSCISEYKFMTLVRNHLLPNLPQIKCNTEHLLEVIPGCGCPMLGPGFMGTGTMPAAFDIVCFCSLVLRFSSSSFWILQIFSASRWQYSAFLNFENKSEVRKKYQNYHQVTEKKMN